MLLTTNHHKTDKSHVIAVFFYTFVLIRLQTLSPPPYTLCIVKAKSNSLSKIQTKHN